MFWSCILIGVPAFLLIIGLLFVIVRGDFFDSVAMFTCILLGGFGILVVLISIPLMRIQINSEIQRFYAVQNTVDYQRKAGKEIEGTAMVLKIAEVNEWLAQTKYFRKLIVLWYPKEIENLNPIK